MDEDANVIASGHNKRVQENDLVAHGEIDCMRTAGRKPRYNNVTIIHNSFAMHDVFWNSCAIWDKKSRNWRKQKL